eukprot:6174068-Pleurochrysis_carterae.AAC.2
MLCVDPAKRAGSEGATPIRSFAFFAQVADASQPAAARFLWHSEETISNRVCAKSTLRVRFHLRAPRLLFAHDSPHFITRFEPHFAQPPIEWEIAARFHESPVGLRRHNGTASSRATGPSSRR